MPYFKSKLQSVYNKEREATLRASLWGESDERFDDFDGGGESSDSRSDTNEQGSVQGRAINRIKKIIAACYPWIHAGNEGLCLFF